MKVLSIREPYVSAIKEGIKHIETRSFKTSYRGELYIHASLSKIKESDERKKRVLSLLQNKNMCYGKIVCKCNLVDCIYMDQDYINNVEKNKNEYLCGDYQIGRYAWILENIEILEEEIEAKGQLGIWNYPKK